MNSDSLQSFAAIPLNSLQQAVVKQIQDKVAAGYYRLEAHPCRLCNGTQFERIAEYDRYGLYAPMEICRACGLIQANPMMTLESYAGFYSEEYRQLNEGKIHGAPSLFRRQYMRGKFIYSYIIRYLKQITTKPFVLEIGCSAGGILKAFEEMGCRVCGIDLDRESIELGQKEHNLDLRYGTIRDLKLDRSPDLVILSHVVEHMVDPLVEMEMLHNISSCAYVYVAVPGLKRIHRTHFCDINLLLQTAHTHNFSLRSLANVMSRAGYELVKGDESVRSLFKPCPEAKSRPIQSDYQDMMIYLHRMERLRRFVPMRSALKMGGRWAFRRFPIIHRWV